MAVFITVAANKGGAGKTLITLNLTGAIRKSFPEAKILVVDTDAQGNATKSFRVKVKAEQNTIYDVFMGNCKVSEAIVTTYDDKIDVLPANTDNNYLEFDKMVEFRDTILEWFVDLLKKFKNDLKKIMTVEGLKRQMKNVIDQSQLSQGLLLCNSRFY